MKRRAKRIVIMLVSYGRVIQFIDYNRGRVDNKQIDATVGYDIYKCYSGTQAIPGISYLI